jgi:hypothetical protein
MDEAGYSAQRAAFEDALEARLASELEPAADALLEGELALDWDPERFETQLDDWMAGSGRLLELLRELREGGGPSSLPLRDALDLCVSQAAVRLSRPQELRRAAMSPDLAHRPLASFVVPVLRELLVDIGNRAPVASTMQLQIDESAILLEIRAPGIEMPELGTSPVAAPVLELLGCATARIGTDSWVLAWDGPVPAAR